MKITSDPIRWIANRIGTCSPVGNSTRPRSWTADRDRLLGGSDCQVALDELAADEHGLDVVRIAQDADVGGRVPVDDDEIG